MRAIIPFTIAACFLAGAAQAEMSVSFQWGNIPRCTTGNPNTVPSPEFILKGVPAGTNRLQIRLSDLDAPSYDHGGGTVKATVSGAAKIPGGVFKYKSPCPPSGSHRYQWTVTAKQGNKTLGKATAMQKYP